MRRSLTRLLGLAIACSCLGATAYAQLTIDDFSDAQAQLTDPGTTASVAGGAGVLGGERDLTVTRVGGTATVSVEVTGGQLLMTTPAATTGRVAVTWDGLDGDAGSLDPAGLSTDLTQGGTQGSFVLLISSASAGAQLQIDLWSGPTQVSRVTAALPAISSQQAVLLDFSQITAVAGVAPAQLDAIGALRLTLLGDQASVTLDDISTAAPLVTLSKTDVDALGTSIGTTPVTPGTTFRYRITVDNAGGEVSAARLTDVLDPQLVGGALRSTALARDDRYDVIENRTLDTTAGGLADVLGNDLDVDGDALVAVATTGLATLQGGSVNIAADGSFVYTPPTGFEGTDSFDYTLMVAAGDPTIDANGNAIGPILATVQVDVLRRPTLRSSPGYGVERELVGAGGTSEATSTSYRLRGSVGQAGLTRILNSAASQSIDSGFWQRRP